MKHCPQCNRNYADPTVSFCLEDGARLIYGPAVQEPETAILSGDVASEAPTKQIDAHTTEPTESRPFSRLTGDTPARWNRRFWTLGGLAIAVILASVIAYRYFATANAAQIGSIAVMPFVNASGNPDIEYLSDGLTESLINSLSQIPRLSVKARSSVFTYKGKEVSPQQVAKDLSVQAILNGRVVQRADQIILSVDLVDAKTGNQIWGEQYNRKMIDLWQLQSEIARDVSSTLKRRLSGPEEQRVEKSYTQDNEAYQLYLRGRYHWNKRTTEDTKKCVEYFQQAIDKDPSYALAYAALAEAYNIFPAYDVEPPDEAYPKARVAAFKAIEMDDSLAEAHNALASVLANYDWKFAEAEAESKKAIALNPNYATAHQWYGEHLIAMGRYNEAVEELKRAQEADPLSMIVNSVLAETYRYQRDPDRAIEQLRKTLEIDPNFPRAHIMLGTAYLQKGMLDEAADELEKAFILQGVNPDVASHFSTTVKDAHRTGGAKAYWRKLVELVEPGRTLGPGRGAPSVVRAGFWAQAGEIDKSFELLEQGYKTRNLDIQGLRDPLLDPIKSDPRYKDLLRRIGLPEE